MISKLRRLVLVVMVMVVTSAFAGTAQSESGPACPANLMHLIPRMQTPPTASGPTIWGPGGTCNGCKKGFSSDIPAMIKQWGAEGVLTALKLENESERDPDWIMVRREAGKVVRCWTQPGAHAAPSSGSDYDPRNTGPNDPYAGTDLAGMCLKNPALGMCDPVMVCLQLRKPGCEGGKRSAPSAPSRSSDMNNCPSGDCASH